MTNYLYLLVIYFYLASSFVQATSYNCESIKNSYKKIAQAVANDNNKYRSIRFVGELTPESIIAFWKKHFPPVLQSEPADPRKIEAVQLAILDAIKNSKKAKVRHSGAHQQDNLDSVLDDAEMLAEMKRLGFREYAFRMGVIDSDKAKDPAYLNMFTSTYEHGFDHQGRSNRFLSSLTNKGIATKYVEQDTFDGLVQKVQQLGTLKTINALSELFADLGLAPSIFNPEASIAEIKELFSKLPMLQNYFHELPGISDMSYLLELGYITKADFQDFVLHNLSHNNPVKNGFDNTNPFISGFWNFLADGIIANAASAAGLTKLMQKVFDNGIFEGKLVTLMKEGKAVLDESGNPIQVYRLGYPDAILVRYHKQKAAELLRHVKTANIEESKRIVELQIGAFAHQLSDRLSGASRGGATKIQHELNFLDPVKGISNAKDLLVGNPTQVRTQLSLLADRLRSTYLERVSIVESMLVPTERLDYKQRLLNHLEQQYTFMRYTMLEGALNYIQAYEDFIAKTFDFNEDLKTIQIKFPHKIRTFKIITKSDDPNINPEGIYEVIAPGRFVYRSNESFVEITNKRLEIAEQSAEIGNYENAMHAYIYQYHLQRALDL